MTNSSTQQASTTHVRQVRSTWGVLLWACQGGCVSLMLLAVSSADAKRYDPSTDPDFVPFKQVIENIYIDNGDIFDLDNPKENKLFFRLANRIHINTRKQVIRDLLLFEPGDILSSRKLAESERILRSQVYIKDARIVPVNIRPDKVDVQVTTHDSWTLSPSANFSREGGENKSSFSLTETNLLGYGKSIGLGRSKNSERSEENFRYQDPNLGGSRHEMETVYSNNSDGRSAKFSFVQPFFSLDAPQSYGVLLHVDKKKDKFLDEAGNSFNVIRNDDFYESFFGFSYMMTKTRSIRLTFGYTYENHDFVDEVTGRKLHGEHDDTESYVWLGSEYVEDRFVRMRRINFINRTEDVNLGHNAHTRVGWASKEIGAGSDNVILRGGYSYSVIPAERRLLTNVFSLDARLTDKRISNGTVALDTRFYHRLRKDITNFVLFNVAIGHHLNIGEEFELGGDSGIRGYPLNLQSGNRRVLLTFEQRYYTDWHVLQLAHVGAVIFFDVGRAYSPGDSYEGNLGVKKDIGFGMRLVSSRSSQDTVIHWDVAFPLDRAGGIDKYQLILKSSSSF